MTVIDIPDWTTAIEVAKDIVLKRTGFIENEKIGEQEIELIKVKNDPETFQEVAAILGKAMELLLISKNQKYGKGNILTATRFGMKVEQGLLLRENDKTERIINSFKGIDLGKEGLLESFGDKAGYAAIGVMLQLKTKDGKTWYELEISEDKK